MNLLLDMNLSPRWCDVLQKHGYACTHWSSVGNPKATDEEIMKWAADNEYVVLTHDLDFGAILAATQAAGPSVLQLRAQDLLPEHLESLLLMALRRFETELRDGALVVLDEVKLRGRVLPLD